MNQAILMCLLGLTAILVMCSSEPLEKRSHNWAEVFAATTANPEVKAKETKAVSFQECRKLKKSGITAECYDDEIAVGCAGTGVHGCDVSQTFGARGCAVDKNSCGDDFVMTPSRNAMINAVCCKRSAVRVVQ